MCLPILQVLALNCWRVTSSVKFCCGLICCMQRLKHHNCSFSQQIFSDNPPARMTRLPAWISALSTCSSTISAPITSRGIRFVFQLKSWEKKNLFFSFSTVALSGSPQCLSQAVSTSGMKIFFARSRASTRCIFVLRRTTPNQAREAVLQPKEYFVILGTICQLLLCFYSLRSESKTSLYLERNRFPFSRLCSCTDGTSPAMQRP